MMNPILGPLLLAVYTFDRYAVRTYALLWIWI